MLLRKMPGLRFAAEDYPGTQNAIYDLVSVALPLFRRAAAGAEVPGFRLFGVLCHDVPATFGGPNPAAVQRHAVFGAGDPAFP